MKINTAGKRYDCNTRVCHIFGISLFKIASKLDSTEFTGQNQKSQIRPASGRPQMVVADERDGATSPKQSGSCILGCTWLGWQEDSTCHEAMKIRQEVRRAQ